MAIVSRTELWLRFFSRTSLCRAQLASQQAHCSHPGPSLHAQRTLQHIKQNGCSIRHCNTLNRMAAAVMLRVFSMVLQICQSCMCSSRETICCCLQNITQES